MRGTGTTRIATGASLTVTGLGALDEARHLVNEGTMTMRGVLRATGGELANADTLNVEAGAATERTWGPGYVVTNTGTLLATGATVVGTELRNHGRVAVSRGTRSADAAGCSSGERGTREVRVSPGVNRDTWGA